MRYKNYWLREKRKIRNSWGIFEGTSVKKKEKAIVKKISVPDYLWCVSLIFHKDTSTEIFSPRYFLFSPKKHFRLHLFVSLSKRYDRWCFCHVSLFNVLSAIPSRASATYVLDFHLIQSYAEATILILNLIFFCYFKISSVSNNKRNSRRKS